MKFYTLSGTVQNVNVSDYLINWNKNSLSIFQKDVKTFLKRYWKNQIILEEMPVPGSRMRVDFVNLTLRIAIEVNGAQHVSFNKHMHGGDSDKYREQIARDLKKMQWCQKNNLKFVEIYPDDMPLTKEWFSKNYSIIL